MKLFILSLKWENCPREKNKCSRSKKNKIKPWNTQGHGYLTNTYHHGKANNISQGSSSSNTR